MKVVFAIGLLLPLLLAQASPVVVTDAEAVVSVVTTSGLIFGHPSPNRTGVTEFLGVPYAASTGGSQRFLPPQPFASNATFEASKYVSRHRKSVEQCSG
jgi:hypothetical protein